MLVGETVFLRPLELQDSQKMVESSEDEEIRYMTNSPQSFSKEVIEKEFSI